MYTRSLIQQHLEMIDILESFKENINSIMDQVIIENSVFGCNRQGSVREIFTGYFIEDQIFENLSDCVKNLKQNQYIQIKENSQFITGYIQQNLFNCPENARVLDLETMEYVR